MPGLPDPLPGTEAPAAHRGEVTESNGTRLGRLLASEPELTQVQDGDFLRRWIDYVTADGFGVGDMVRGMERLKFEMIVQEKSCAEVLAEAQKP